MKPRRILQLFAMLLAALLLAACSVPGRNGPGLLERLINSLVPVPAVAEESIPEHKDVFEMTQEEREANNPEGGAEAVSHDEMYDNLELYTSVTTGVVYYRDQAYKSASADAPDANLFDFCIPSDVLKNDENMPFILFVSGGAWRSVHKESMQTYLLTLAHYGYAAASINYRTLPEYSYAEQLEDVLDAIQHFYDNAEVLFIDKDKMFITGFSAGGNLSLMAAYTEGAGFAPEGAAKTYDFDIKALAAVAAPVMAEKVVLDSAGLTAETAGEISAASRQEVEFFLDGTLEEDLALLGRIDPRQYITHDSPPTLVLQGMQDTTVTPENSDALYHALIEAGVESYLTQYADATHTNMPAEQVLKDILYFFRPFLEARETAPASSSSQPALPSSSPAPSAPAPSSPSNE